MFSDITRSHIITDLEVVENGELLWLRAQDARAQEPGVQFVPNEAKLRKHARELARQPWQRIGKFAQPGIVAGGEPPLQVRRVRVSHLHLEFQIESGRHFAREVGRHTHEVQGL